MKSIPLFVSMLLLAAETASSQPPRTPTTPAPVLDVVLVRPFTLSRGFQFDWRADRPTVASGTLLVLKVDPALVYPRDAAEPVLYVGNQTAQRLNHGSESGHVIALVPGPVDLARDPIWFGQPDLPERITQETIRRERSLADAAKIQPLGESKVRAATQERMQAADLSALLRDQIADLLLQYSPQEKDLAETWRLPVATARPKPQ